MPRLRKKHLPHRVTLTPLAGEGAEGPTTGTPIPNVPAYVEKKAKLVVDRRTTSETAGREITATTLVVLLLDNEVQPGSTITIWPGTARARTSEVIGADYYEYNARTPNHVEVWLT